MLRVDRTERLAQQCQTILYFLINILVFEGVLRKLFPPLSLLIFFLKDILCFYALYLLREIKFPSFTYKLVEYWKQIFFLSIPIFINTALYDFSLILYGGKQYFLFVVVALLVVSAFPPSRIEDFKRFISYLSFLIVPTTLVAIIQLSLPPTHWLNLSVTGNTLTEFSSNGVLRVQSTFSFTGQYGFFLNGICMIFGARIFLVPNYNNPLLKFLGSTWFLVITASALLIGVFITGGRTSVLGCSACFAVGLFFLIAKSSGKVRRQIVGWTLSGFLLLVAIRIVKPEFFTVYDGRSQNQFNKKEDSDFSERFYNNFLHWIDFVNTDNIFENILGRGMGVMSNGSESFSNYAKRIKTFNGDRVFWTEQDLETVVWEGGILLLIIFYGFRVYMILYCILIWRTLRKREYVAATSLLIGDVVISAIFGGMAKQPPVSIWFWLAIGLILCIERLDKAVIK